MVAKREIVIGEPLTVCYIDDADSTDLVGPDRTLDHFDRISQFDVTHARG